MSFCFISSAQNMLTKRQIFDFEVGDEFHYSVGIPVNFLSSNGISIVEKITNKYVSADSFIYTVDRIQKNSFPCPCPNTFDTFTYMRKYGDLDSFIQTSPVTFRDFGTIKGCPDLSYANCQDSMYVSTNFLNRQMNYFSFFGLASGESRFVEKMGHTHLRRGENREFYTARLVYYKSVLTSEQYGEKIDMVAVGLSEMEGAVKIGLSPNPFDKVINVEVDDFNSNSVYRIVLYNSIGELIVEQVFSNENSNIELSSLHPGIYNFIFVENDTPIAFRKLVKL